MSYDISFDNFEEFNHTLNQAKLFHKHIRHGDKTGVQALDGLFISDVKPILVQALRDIEKEVEADWRVDVPGNPIFCAKYDSPNGWGSAISAILFIANVLGSMSLASTNSIVRVHA